MKYLTMYLLSHLLFLGLSISLDAMIVETMATESSAPVLDLHKAALSGDSILLKKMLAISSELIDERDAFGDTPLLLAVKNGHQECALILISCGSNVWNCDRDGVTVLYLARKLRLLKVIDALINGIDSDSSKILIDKLAGKMVDSQYSSRLLLAVKAVKQNCRYILLRLLDAGVNINSPAKGGKTLLHFAATYESVPLYTLLLTKGAREDQRDMLDKRVYDYGSLEFHVEIAEASIHRMVQKGDFLTLRKWALERAELMRAVFNQTYEGMTLLHRAILSGSEKMLLEVWKQIPRFLMHFRDRQGNSSLVLAAKKGFVVAIKLFIEHSKIEACNNQKAASMEHILECVLINLSEKNISRTQFYELIYPFLDSMSPNLYAIAESFDSKFSPLEVLRAKNGDRFRQKSPTKATNKSLIEELKGPWYSWILESFGFCIGRRQTKKEIEKLLKDLDDRIMLEAR